MLMSAPLRASLRVIMSNFKGSFRYFYLPPGAISVLLFVLRDFLLLLCWAFPPFVVAVVVCLSVCLFDCLFV